MLDRAIYRTYAEAGITADVTTHGRPAPLLRDLHTVLGDTPGEVAASLAVRLDRYVEGSLSAGLFAGPTNVELDRRLVVFNIQQLEEELRPLAMHLIAGWVWTRVRRDRRPRLLVIDEAWSLLRFPEGGAFVAAMARRARKYYLGLVTITQQVADLADGGHGGTILGNAAQVLLLKQKADTIDAATARFRLTPTSGSCCSARTKARACCWCAATASRSRSWPARPNTGWPPPTRATWRNWPRPRRPTRPRRRGFIELPDETARRWGVLAARRRGRPGDPVQWSEP